MITEEDINRAYATLAMRKRAFQEASEAEASALRALKTSKASYILSGRVVGKNEAERDACATSLLTAEISDADEQERWRREAQYDFEIAQLEVDRIKLIIRLLELSTKGREGV